MTATGLRLAIVGGGPRAAYALDCLAQRKAAGLPTPARVDVYEPRPVLGTGAAYAPDQPDWILLNLPDRVIDAGARASDGAGRPLIGDLRQWSGRGFDSADDIYPPRSVAGRYLAELAHRAIERLRPAEVRHLAHEVSAVKRGGTGFTIWYGDDTEAYDAVLLATGHARAWSGQMPSVEPRNVPALPVSRLIAVADRLAPERVCIRGAALTAIDAALALSEGLGGSFMGNERTSSRLNFRPGGRVVHLVMASRSGRLMDIKTESSVLRRYRTAEAAAPLLAAFDTKTEHVDIAELIRTLAVAILTRAQGFWPGLGGPNGIQIAYTRQVDAGWRDLGAPLESDDARTQLERSLAQARGEQPPDGRWAIGQAWRTAYPHLVRHQQRHVDSNAVGPLGWRDYPRWARALERLAFGPPPANGAKILALMEAGLLAVSTVTDTNFDDFTAEFDLVVDAVTAPPGVRRIGDPLWRQLLDDGLVVAAPYGRGVLVDGAAGCLDRSGAQVSGLSVVGRATEDVVIGNDTLIRTLHTDLECWADRLCRSRELVG